MRNSNFIVTAGADAKIVITDYLDKNNPTIITNLSSVTNASGVLSQVTDLC